MPMFEDSIFNPARAVQRVGDYFEQRKAFRLAALVALRKREGLPGPVDQDGSPLETRLDDFGNAAYYNSAGEKVSRVMFAGVGTRKGAPLEDATRNWVSGRSVFEILDVAEDGRKLTDELVDLHRDAATYERAERVSHGAEGEQAPDLVLDGVGDEEVDQRLQEYLKRGPR
jgi:glutaredoxin